MLSWIRHIAEGVGIGIANVIPGVSGGTMALIFGIYERLIDIAAAAVQAGMSFLRLDFSSSWSKIRVLPFGFIIPLVAGIVLAPILGAGVIPDAMETWPEASRALFFGLILGSIAIPWLRVRRVGPREVALTLLAAALAFVLSGLPPTEIADPTLFQVFLAAAVAMCAMILPGVSGAFLLLVFGLYAPILNAVDERQLVVIGVFLLGSFSGLGAFAMLMRWLLRSYHDRTMAVLVGLMIGSLRALWPWLGESRELLWYPRNASLSGVLALFAAGFILSLAITVYELRKQRSPKPPT